MVDGMYISVKALYSGGHELIHDGNKSTETNFFVTKTATACRKAFDLWEQAFHFYYTLDFAYSWLGQYVWWVKMCPDLQSFHFL